MRLELLLEGMTEDDRRGVEGVEVTGITHDSRRVTPGTLFCAVRGEKADGHDFVADALKRGAAAILASDGGRVPAGVPAVIVPDSRRAMAVISHRFYGSPTQTRPLFGVTGTNGKTTTTFLLESILRQGGWKPAVLGTVGYRFGHTTIEASHTTPESTELAAHLRVLADEGADSYVMEVSSHSLDQHRVDGLRFDVGIFTNLTRDHLDYHGEMEAYLAAKERLFAQLLAPGCGKGPRTSVINRDDPAATRLIRTAAGPVITFGLSRDADVTVSQLSMTTEGTRGTIHHPGGSFTFASPLVGSFNVSNILAATAAAVAFGIGADQIGEGIGLCRGAPGRLERVANDRGITVLVDYAHTGDALENVLSTISRLGSGRIITVFGCGGDRDRGKRPIMGEIAVRFSDLAVVTSDNPRTEDPLRIIDDILAGIRTLGVKEYGPKTLPAPGDEKGFLVEPDRRRAIALGIAAARPGDILLIAGKGHEDYQIVGTVKHHFDDREEARLILSGGRRGDEALAL